MKLTPIQATYLNLLRGMASLMVLVGHGSIFFLADSLLFRMNIQAAGVYIFFLLSGFLISYSVFTKHTDRGYGFRQYFIDRFARIYTGFLPALIFVWLVDRLTMTLPQTLTPERWQDLGNLHQYQINSTLHTWLGNLLMLQDFPLFQILRKLAGVEDNSWLFRSFGTAVPFWTISVEWWIYMLFGAIAVWRMKTQHPLRWWHWALIALAAIEPVYYMVGGYDSCLSLLWVFGMDAAFLFMQLPRWEAARQTALSTDHKRHNKLWLAAAVAGVIGMTGRLIALKLNTGNVSFTEFQFTFFLGVTIFALLFAIRDLPPLVSWLSRPIAFLADFSFSLYLTHFTVLSYLYLRFPGHDNDITMLGIAAAISLVIAIAFWFLFERHYRHIGGWLKHHTT